MLLNVRAQLRLRYIGWRTGENTCNAGEKVFRKAAEVCNNAADKCAEGAKHCKGKGIKVKDLLKLHDEPESQQALGALVEQQRQRNDESEVVTEEQVRDCDNVQFTTGMDDAEAFEEELVVEDVHDDTDTPEPESVLEEHQDETSIGIDDTNPEAEYLVLEEESA